MRSIVAFFTEVRTPLNAETRAKEKITITKIATIIIPNFNTFLMGVLSDFGVWREVEENCFIRIAFKNKDWK
jgi:hypothetical protein